MNRLFKTLLLALLIPVCTYASGWNDEEWYQTLPIGSHLLGRIGMLELLTMHLRIQGYRLGQGLRPQLINFVRSERILIKDVTLLNSPFWVIHPLLCKNITVSCASSYSQKHSSRKRYKFLIDKHLNRWRVIPHSSPLFTTHSPNVYRSFRQNGEEWRVKPRVGFLQAKLSACSRKP